MSELEMIRSLIVEPAKDIRLNLSNVPEEHRPAQEPLEVDYDPWAGRAPGRRTADES